MDLDFGEGLAIIIFIINGLLALLMICYGTSIFIIKYWDRSRRKHRWAIVRRVL